MPSCGCGGLHRGAIARLRLAQTAAAPRPPVFWTRHPNPDCSSTCRQCAGAAAAPRWYLTWACLAVLLLPFSCCVSLASVLLLALTELSRPTEKGPVSLGLGSAVAGALRLTRPFSVIPELPAGAVSSAGQFGRWGCLAWGTAPWPGCAGLSPDVWQPGARPLEPPLWRGWYRNDRILEGRRCVPS